MPESLVLITGGTRSGKSRKALEIAGAHAPRTFVATAATSDQEMGERIARHRAERDPSWTTIEELFDLAAVLSRRPEGGLVVDCMTLWLANVLERDLDIAARLEELLAAARARRGLTVVVTNEVGMGIVPPYDSGRRFRDEAGWMNQRLAAAADRVVLVVCGLDVGLK